MNEQFILISVGDFNNLLSFNGAVQLSIIALSMFLSMMALLQFKNRPIYQKMLDESPVTTGILTCVIPSVVCFVLALIGGELYGLIFHHNTPLTRSISLLSLLVGIVGVITFLIDKSFSHDTKFKSLRTVIKCTIWFLLIMWVTDFDKVLATNLSKTYVDFGNSKVPLWEIISNVFFVLYAIGGVFWAIAIFDNVIVTRITLLEENEKSLIKRIFKIFAGFVGIYIVLPTFGVNVTGLSVLGGGLGVGIGLGLQKIASNFISGFIILIDKSIKIGDRVVINNITGTITQITTRYTVMEAFDGSEILIPNEQFMTSTVINQTHTNTEIGVEITVSVGYNSDLRKVIEITKDIIAKHELINQAKDPTISVKNLGASGIDIFIRVWPLDALNNMSTVRNDITIAIVETYRDNGIEIPFPKMDVTLLNGDKQ